MLLGQTSNLEKLGLSFGNSRWTDLHPYSGVRTQASENVPNESVQAGAVSQPDSDV